MIVQLNIRNSISICLSSPTVRHLTVPAAWLARSIAHQTLGWTISFAYRVQKSQNLVSIQNYSSWVIIDWYLLHRKDFHCLGSCCLHACSQNRGCDLNLLTSLSFSFTPYFSFSFSLDLSFAFNFETHLTKGMNRKWPKSGVLLPSTKHKNVFWG